MSTQTKDQLERDLCHPKGHLKACLLLLVAAKPAHGYELAEAVKRFGYEQHESATVYRALRWLEGGGFIRATWHITGHGPARRMFTVTPSGRRAARTCAMRLSERAQELQSQLSPYSGPEDGTSRHFEVLAEVELSVAAEDEESAAALVEDALGRARQVAPGIRSTGRVWTYQAAKEVERRVR